MYNINFDVKYNSIENELLEKIKLGETDYSKEDIQIICEKLYNDEFTSVFFSENIFDDKIDDGIKYIMEEMIKNIKFVSLLNEIKGLLMFDQASDKNNTYDYPIFTECDEIKTYNDIQGNSLTYNNIQILTDLGYVKDENIFKLKNYYFNKVNASTDKDIFYTTHFAIILPKNIIYWKQLGNKFYYEYDSKQVIYIYTAYKNEGKESDSWELKKIDNKNIIAKKILIDNEKKQYDKIYNKDKFNKYKFDVIIFHEGNITKEHQEIIQNFISEMPLEFKQLTFQKNVATPFIRLCPPSLP